MVTREARLGGRGSRKNVQQTHTFVLQDVYHVPRLESQCIMRLLFPPNAYERCGIILAR